MGRTSEFRPEIQGLRAIAVIAVLIFHLWPSVLPGGYIGVDVFFVISGFLITGILLRQAERTGRIDVVGFYIKRLKRLLPAATVVLLSVAVCISLLPITRWVDTANEIAASALYVENWWLAIQAVDYLAAENAASPLQHYWSLSVEEQYYIVWPLLFGLAISLSVNSVTPVRRKFLWIIVCVGLCSFAYSVYLTPRSPGVAYFATTTRAWELALGGALALLSLNGLVPSWMRLVSGLAGLTFIILAALFFDAETSFPGYSALLPTIGAALLIVSGTQDHALSISKILNSRPMQYVGDLSYSLYLWHWPVIIFYQSVAGRQLGVVDGVGAAAISLALAHQTKVLVEDEFRRPEFLGTSRWKPFAFAALCISVPIICWQAINYQAGRHENAVMTDVSAQMMYPGALTLSDGIKVETATPLPAVLSAKADRGAPYREGCIVSLLGTDLKECTYGASDGLHIALLGDSHAVHWVPTLQVIAEYAGARVTVITKSACAINDLSERFELQQYQACTEWSEKAISRLLELNPDIAIFAHSRSSLSKIRKSRDESAVAVAASLSRIWNKLEGAGVRVFAIRDTPSFSEDVPDCLAAAAAEECRVSRARMDARLDPLVLAVKASPGVKLMDLTGAICDDDYCYGVVGNVVAWRDAHHMTETFARTLAPEMSRQMSPLLPEVPISFLLESPLIGHSDSSPCSTDLKSCLSRVKPSLPAVAKDFPVIYRQQGCHATLQEDEARPCVLEGQAENPLLMVVGDSHAAQWFPVYEHLASAHGWHTMMTTKAACSFADVVVRGGRSRTGPYSSCTSWGKNVMKLLVSNAPDVVLISQSTTYTVAGKEKEASFEDLKSGYTRRISEVKEETAAEVIVLADTPRLGFNAADCLSRQGAVFEKCSGAAAEVLSRRDPLVDAAREVGVPIVNANDLICPDHSCPPIINDVIVWRDSHHVTATFAKESAPIIAQRIVGAFK